MARLHWLIPLAFVLDPAAALRSQTAVRITVEPREALLDESVTVRVSGLPPDSDFTLRAAATDALGRAWRSETLYRYGKDEIGMKPFWSMTMAPEVPAARRAPPGFARPDRGHYDVVLAVVAGGRVVASATARRNATGDSVKVSDIRESGMIGRLYEPGGAGKHAAVLVLTGSNGGIPTQHAALLAARGYVAFALAYYRVEGMPDDLVELPLEYFERAVSWLRQRESVDPSRLGVIGISKGAELSLLLPTLHTGLFQAVVAISPTSVVWEGGIRNPKAAGIDSIKPNRSSWSLHGRPLPFLPKRITPETKERIAREGSVDTIEFYRPALDDTAAVQMARIPVEKIAAPVLLVSSAADRMWPSALMAAEVCAAMRRNRLSCERLEYPDAAHMILEPGLPVVYGTFPTAPGRWDRPSLGGSAEGSAQAGADSWPKVLRFFGQHLAASR